MKRSYIPLSSLCDFFGFESIEDLISNKSSLKEIAESKFNEGIIFSDGNLAVSREDFFRFLELLDLEGIIVFDQWINSCDSAKKLLLNGILTKNDFPVENFKAHFLFLRFKKFISPFLWKFLLTKIEEDSKNQTLVSSYIPILDIDFSIIIQSEIEKNIKLSWENVDNNSLKVSTEMELIHLLGLYFSDEKINLLNCLTKEFYSQKIKIIDDATTIFNHSSSNTRIIFWILGQLRKLDLNAEHKNRIEAIYRSVKNGDGEYFKKESLLKNKFPWKKFALFTIIGSLCAYLIFLSFKPENNWEDDPNSASAFTGFSKQERMQIDSLIQSLSKTEEKTSGQKNDYTYLHLSPVSIDLSERKAFRNQKVDKFVQDMFKTQELIESGELDSCAKFKQSELEKQIITPFKSLTKKDSQGDKNLYLKNESSFDVLVVVFENFEKGKSQATYIGSKTELSFKVNEGDRLLLIPGKNAGKIYFKDSKEKQRNFFCFTDENFSLFLQQSYEIARTNFTDLKVLLNEDKSGNFYFIDLNQALKETP